ncbi:PP2C family protein-serine/threonine phosphatase [Streptomyces sp. NPDC006662]|uniref:PP2C family protein-serine/threonine phosphatase n=1 Tax=Streptomyces sp. NPDC006662 TaxID=3156902 RepID=UPI0034108B50
MSRLFWALAPLREEVRDLAAVYRLPADLRGRLVLSVTDVAAPEFEAGHPVRLTAVRDASGTGAHLAVTLTAPRAKGPLQIGGLALTALAASATSVTWNITLPDPACTLPGGTRRAGQPEHGPGAPADPAGAADEELRAALALADGLAAERRRLKHELAETNAGVLALYVHLEERQEEAGQAHGRVLRELEDALRPEPLEAEGMELAVHVAPADPGAPTGGDLYDWFTLPDGTVHITVVDALGDGVRGIRTAITVTHAVRTLALEGHALDSVLARSHDILMSFDAGLRATVLLARLDVVTGELQIANGGHPAPVLVRTSGTARYLEARGRGIGQPGSGGEGIRRDRVAPGDLLLLYTDGLVESGEDPVEGERRLIASARTHADRALCEVPAAIAADMHSGVPHAGDTLVLAVRLTSRVPPSAPAQPA